MPGSVIGEAFIEVKPRTEGFEGAAEGGVNQGLGSIAKKAAVLFGGALALGAAGEFVKKFVEAGQKADALNRVTAAVVKATGGATHVSAAQVGELGDKLAALTGIDDETVKAADNIILSFKNIKNEAGAGNDIFDQTAKAALDMATVMGTDASGAALQLSKALNDPAQGLSKLQRAGVTFTDQQKEQIKTLQASGDILGAQKIILAEVGSEFGGAAEAAADPLKRMKVATDELKESIGSALIPVLAPAATAIANFVASNKEGIVHALTKALDGLVGVARFLIPGFQNIAKAAGDLISVFTPLIDLGKSLVSDVFEKLNPSLDLAGRNANIVSTALAGIVTALAAMKIAGAAGSTVAPLIKSLSSVAPLLPNPYVLVAAAIVAIAAAAVYAYVKFQAFRDIVDSVASFFVDLFNNAIPTLRAIGDLAVTVGQRIADGFNAALPTLAAIGSGIADAFQAVVSTASTVAGAVGDAFSSLSSLPTLIGPVIDVLQGALAPAIHFVEDAWAKYGDQVTGILVGFRDIAVTAFERVRGILLVFVGQIANVASVIRAILGPAFDFLAATVEIALAPLRTILGGVLQAAQVIIQTFISIVVPLWTTAWSTFSDIVANVIGPISNVLEGFLTVIQGFVDIVAGIFTLDWSRAWEGLGEVASGAIEIVQGILEEMIGFLEAIWANITDLITLPFVITWAQLQGVVALGIDAAQTAFQGFLDFLGAVWSNASTLITAPVQIAYQLLIGLLNGIVLLFAALPGNVLSALSSFASTLASAATTALTSMGNAVTSGISDVVGFFAGLPGKAVDAISSLGTMLFNAVGTAFSLMTEAVNLGIDGIVGFFAGLPGKIVDALSGLGGLLKGAFEGAWNALADAWNSTIGGVGFSVPDWVPGVGGDSVNVPNLPRFHTGGVVQGSAGSQQLAMLLAGETVFTPDQLAALGRVITVGATTRTSVSSEAFTVDASFTNNGTIFGVDDLQGILDAQADRLTDIVASGRRGSLG